MAAKNQKAQANKKTGDPSMEGVRREQLRERRLIANLEASSRLNRWLLIAVIILLLLFILFAGYATDWLTGLRKDNATSPVSSNLNATRDSSRTTGSSDDSAAANTDTSNAERPSGGAVTTNTNTSKSTETIGTNRDSTSTTTTTTTNNTVTPASPANPGLVSLYADSGVGDNIATVLSRAHLLNVSSNCRTEVLIQVCDLSDGSDVVTVKNLLGTGIVTSITKNF